MLVCEYDPQDPDDQLCHDELEAGWALHHKEGTGQDIWDYLMDGTHSLVPPLPETSPER